MDSPRIVVEGAEGRLYATIASMMREALGEGIVVAGRGFGDGGGDALPPPASLVVVAVEEGEAAAGSAGVPGLCSRVEALVAAGSNVVVFFERICPSPSWASALVSAGAREILEGGDPSCRRKLANVLRALGIAVVGGVRTRAVRGVPPGVGETPAPPLVAIASSAGGPRALLHVLPALNRNPGAVFLLVQHMDERFFPSFMRWMSDHSTVPVVEAEDGMTASADVLHVCPAGFHLELSHKDRLVVSGRVGDEEYVPSADRLFSSLARVAPERSLAVVLSGMGRDGVRGAGELRSRGGSVFVQEGSSCVVPGMPCAVASSVAVDRVVAAERIAEAIAHWIASRRRAT